MQKKLLKGLLYGIGLLMLGHIVVSADWREMFHHLQAIPLGVIILLLLFQCLTMLLLALQWRSLAAEAGQAISLWDMLLVNAQGTITDGLTPGMKMGGELVRVLALKNRARMDLAQATVVVGLQKTFSLLSFLILSLSSLVWLSLGLGSGNGSYLYLFATALAIFLMMFSGLILLTFKPHTIVGAVGKILKNPAGQSRLQEALGKYSHILQELRKNKRLFLAQISLGLFIWSFYAFKLFVLIRGYQLELSYITVAAITFLAYVMGMVPLLPGGIGSFESAMILLLKLAGVPMEMGASIAIVFRVVTFWFEFIISGLLMLLAQLPLACRGGPNAKVQV